MHRTPFASVEPTASTKWFDALALSAIASFEIRVESEIEAHKTSTWAHSLFANRWALRLISCASDKSGSIATTSPDLPERAAAQKLNNPTLAPTSHTVEPGFTISSAMLYSTGSTCDMVDQ